MPDKKPKASPKKLVKQANTKKQKTSKNVKWGATKKPKSSAKYAMSIVEAKSTGAPIRSGKPLKGKTVRTHGEIY